MVAGDRIREKKPLTHQLIIKSAEWNRDYPILVHPKIGLLRAKNECLMATQTSYYRFGHQDESFASWKCYHSKKNARKMVKSLSLMGHFIKWLATVHISHKINSIEQLTYNFAHREILSWVVVNVASHHKNRRIWANWKSKWINHDTAIGSSIE